MTILDDIEGTVESLNNYIKRKSLENTVISVENNLYTMRIDGDIEYQTQRYEDMAVHIDVIVLDLRFS